MRLRFTILYAALTVFIPFPTLGARTQLGTSPGNFPDLSKDRYGPYPPLPDDDTGVNATNWWGTRLRGWIECEPREQQMIVEAYNDMHKIADLDGVYKNIDWDDQATREFFGEGDDDYGIPENRRKQIQQVFAAVQQVYTSSWTPPFVPFYWIEVRHPNIFIRAI